MDEIAKRVGKSRTEIKYRMQFAETYSSDEEVATAVATLGSWTEIRDSLAKKRERPTFDPVPSPTGTYSLLYVDPPWR